MASAPMDAGLKETLTIFDESEPLTTPEVAEHLDLGRRATYARLHRLVEAGHLETKKVGASARVWWATSTSESEPVNDTEASSRYETLLDSLEDHAVFTVDPSGSIRSWNHGAMAVTGYREEEIIGEHVSRLYPEQSSPEILDRVVEGESIEKREWLQKADTSTFWANVSLSTIRESDGTVEAVLMVVRDLSDRWRYEQRLEHQADRLARQKDDLANELDQIFERITDGFFALDEAFRFTYLNDHAKTLLDLDASVVGADIRAELPLTEAFEEALVEAQETQSQVELRDYYEPLDRWYYSTIYPSESGLSIYFQNITNLIHKEQRLKRYASIVKAIDEPVYELDDEGRIVFVNEPFTESVGVAEEALLGEHVSIGMRDEAIEEVEAHMRDLRRGDAESTAKVEFDLIPRDGEPIPVENRFSLLTDEDGSVRGSAGMLWDISDRQERERRLARFERAVEASGHAIYMANEDREITYVNDAFESLSGYTADELVGSTPEILSSGEHSQDFFAEHWGKVREGHVSEAEIIDRRKNGERYQIEQTLAPVPNNDGEIDRFVAVQKDITERIERQQHLETQIRMQEAISALGHQALEESNLDALLADTVEHVQETLGIDYCELLELSETDEELHMRASQGWKAGTFEETISAGKTGSPAGHAIATGEPVVVEDVDDESRFAWPSMLDRHEVTSSITVLVGSGTDPWGTLSIHAVDPISHTEQRIQFLQSIATILATAFERHASNQELLRQRASLAALNDLNAIVSDVTKRVIEKRTRSEIEEAVCEGIAAADAYEFAWIGAVNATKETIEPRATAGTRGYADAVTIPFETDGPEREGIAARALHDQEIQVIENVEHPPFGPPKETADRYGFRAVSAIPIAHEGSVYGVLCVYADREQAFEENERGLISQLGEIVGHAISAAEQKQALMSDELTELQVKIPEVFGIEEETGRFCFESAIPVSDNAFHVYGSATEKGLETLRSLVDQEPTFHELRVRDRGGTDQFDVRMEDAPLLSIIGSHGGYMDSAVYEDGDLTWTLHVAPTVEVRQLFITIEEAYPQAELLRRQQITRETDATAGLHRHLLAELTEKQQSTLESAYRAGFFSWPRDTTGEEVAASLDVAPATFHQHLRKAQQKLFSAVFAEADNNG